MIETLAGIDTIVFDKTGTLTETNIADVHYTGNKLSATDKSLLKKVTAQSSHTLSKLIYSSFNEEETDQEAAEIDNFKEYPGQGITATINQVSLKMGAAGLLEQNIYEPTDKNGSRVYVMIDNTTKGFFEIKNKYRPGIKDLVDELKKASYELHVVSGDNAAEKERLDQIFTSSTTLNFNTSPGKKLDYIKSLQAGGKKVLMIGDGLNDAGALRQADVGIAVSNNAARFTPACDAIIDGDVVRKTARFMEFAKAGKKVVGAGFALSILYNVVGLSFAVQGRLDPVIAAVLMPASSISIVALASGLSSFIGKRKKL